MASIRDSLVHPYLTNIITSHFYVRTTPTIMYVMRPYDCLKIIATSISSLSELQLTVNIKLV
jgi:hypothetical protein